MIPYEELSEEEKEYDRRTAMEALKTLIALSNNVTFRVENTGAMIPESIREHLFIPGFTTKGDGHGMGLHIVRRTLQDRRGEILVESDQEKTVFSGYIPKLAQAVSETKE